MEQVPHTQIEQGLQLSECIWTVSLEALELANSFRVVIEDTPTKALKRVPVPKEFYGLLCLCDTLIQQLAADGANWGNDDDALYLLFSTEDRRKDGGTTVYLSFT